MLSIVSVYEILHRIPRFPHHLLAPRKQDTRSFKLVMIDV